MSMMRKGAAEKERRRGRGGAGEVRRGPLRARRIAKGSPSPRAPQSNVGNTTSRRAAGVVKSPTYHLVAVVRQ